MIGWIKMNKATQKSALKAIEHKGFTEDDIWTKINEDQWVCANSNDVVAIYRPSTKMLRVPLNSVNLRKRRGGEWEI